MSLSEYRIEIEEIDKEMQKLFIRRMNIVKLVGEYKKNNNLPILDLKRENELLAKLSLKYLDNNTLKYYQQLMEKMFELSKEYQNE